MKIYLISALVGAVIGYITNWLAIKMLFKPHNVKRIFGIRVPFTPGLIPKEKERIAKSVGETVGEHILTNDIIVESLRNDDIVSKLKSTINKKVDEAFNDNFTIEEILKNIQNSGDSIEIKIKEKIYNEIIYISNSKEKNVNISNYIFNYICDSIKEKPVLILKVINSEKFKNILFEINKKQKNNKILDNEVRNIINKKILNFVNEEKILEDVIPNNLTEGISSLIYSQKDLIAENLVKFLENEVFSNKIKDIIGKILPSMLTMFMSVDSLYEKLSNAVREYLLVEENKVILCNCIISILKNLQKTRVEDVIRAMSEEDFNSFCDIAVDLLNNKLLSDENIEICVDKIKEYMSKIDSYESIVLKINKNYKEDLKRFLDSSIESFVKKEEFEALIRKISDDLAKHILTLRIKDVFPNKENVVDFIWNIADKYYNNFVEKDAQELIELVNIPNLIEKQINSFDVSYAEKLIVKIARKELGAITWLGALLGAFLGLLSPILSRLYS